MNYATWLCCMLATDISYPISVSSLLIGHSAYLCHLIYHCRAIKTMFLCVGILLAAIWQLSVRTWLRFGQLVLGAKQRNAFMSCTIVATNSIPVLSIPLIPLCWSLAVTRQVIAVPLFHAISFVNQLPCIVSFGFWFDIMC